jgi:DNA repair ATPase RecN
MKIVKLESQNVKRLKAVEITPRGNVVVIGGANGAGKSSVLDSIWYALGGKDAQCEQPVRQGEQKARVAVTIGDLLVTRTFTPDGGGTLAVTSPDGKMRYGSPQKMLDALVGRLTFDPLAFMRMKPAEQLATLKELVGINFDQLDAKRRAAFESRTQVNRDIKALDGQLKGMPRHDGLPDQEESLDALGDELANANKHNANIEAAKSSLNGLRQTIEARRGEVAKADAEIARWQRYRDDAQAKADDLSQQLAARETDVAAMATVDVAAITAKMRAADAGNQKVRENRARANVVKRFEALAAEAQDHTAEIDRIDAEKASMLAAAKFPVDGLSFGENGVAYKGLPLEQASSAEQLRVSVAMALAANPKLKVLLIRDGSLMDEQSMRLVAGMAAAADAQVWIERVGDGAECSVVIEDGQVKGTEAPAAAEPGL